jgi:hypothetical protein
MTFTERGESSPTASNSAALTEFRRRLLDQWLPAYCNDPRRRYPLEGFSEASVSMSSRDAQDFLRAIDYKVVTVDSGGRFRMPQSKTHEVIFWEHSTHVSPRPITLWLEPVITIAAVARLHLDFGWPIQLLGIQSEDWAFDFTAFKPTDLKSEYIAGEVKGTSRQLERLLTNLHKCCAEGDLECSAPKARKNAHRKMLGLKRCHAPVFWALGPDREGYVFEVSYSSSGTIQLIGTGEQILRFPGANTV